MVYLYIAIKLFNVTVVNVTGELLSVGEKQLSFCYCTRVGTFGTESAVRKRGGSRNLPYLNAKPRQIPLLGTYA